MADGDDFDSSDLDFEQDGPRRPNLGQASIEKIIASAQEDRLSSKRTVRQLDWHATAPGTSSARSLWVQRFEAFREHALHQNLKDPFTGDDVIRFLDSIMGNPPAPPESSAGVFETNKLLIFSQTTPPWVEQGRPQSEHA